MLTVNFVGNYTMFDMVRPMLPGEYGMGRMMDDRMYKPEATLIESAWERGKFDCFFDFTLLFCECQIRFTNCKGNAEKIDEKKGTRH